MDSDQVVVVFLVVQMQHAVVVDVVRGLDEQQAVVVMVVLVLVVD